MPNNLPDTIPDTPTIPHALDIEEAVLGACMVDAQGLPTASAILNVDSFYKGAHRNIYAAMLALYAADKVVDLITVAEQLRSKKLIESSGGYVYLTNLTNRVASSANVEYHSRILVEYQIKRELISTCERLLKRARMSSADALTLLDDYHTEGARINAAIKTNASTSVGAAAQSLLQSLAERIAHPERAGGATLSGIEDLDRATGGWHPSDLAIIAARPGMGKTSFVVDLAVRNAQIFDKASIIFSLEMSTEQLTANILCHVAGVNKSKMRTPSELTDADWTELAAAGQIVADWPIEIVDTTSLTITRLRGKAKELKSKFDKAGIETGLIIIDYLQLMDGEGRSGNREQDVAGMSRGAKKLAKEINVPVIALSQLSRAVEQRGGTKVPQLSDLRESGAIEQDADMVGFIYRPEYYGIVEDAEGQSLKGIAELVIAKNRHGDATTVPMRFNRATGRFDVANPFANILSEAAAQTAAANDEPLPF